MSRQEQESDNAVPPTHSAAAVHISSLGSSAREQRRVIDVIDAAPIAQGRADPATTAPCHEAARLQAGDRADRVPPCSQKQTPRQPSRAQASSAGAAGAGSRATMPGLVATCRSYSPVVARHWGLLHSRCSVHVTSKGRTAAYPKYP